MDYLLATIGLVALIAGGDFLVRGAVAIANRAHVSPLLIGLTVVALGTSAPELVVSIDAAVLKGLPELTLGNAVGSNIANVLLVLGIPALIYPMTCSGGNATRDTLVMIGATVIFIGFCFMGVITFWMGVILVLMLAAYMLYSAHEARKNPALVEEELAELEASSLTERGPALSIACVVGGIIGLVVGADLLVDGAVNIARDLGVSEATIGLTLIAIGTSLPELATSVAAALRRHCDVAIGNVIGSNMFNLLGIVGITALLVPIPVEREFLTLNLWVMLGASVALLPFVMGGRDIGRVAGVIFTGLYVGYLWYLL